MKPSTSTSNRWLLPRWPSTESPAAVTLVVMLLVVLLLGWVNASEFALDAEIMALSAEGVPEWIDTTLTIIFLLGGIYVLGLLVAILAYGRGRRLGRLLPIGWSLHTCLRSLGGTRRDGL